MMDAYPLVVYACQTSPHELHCYSAIPGHDLIQTAELAARTCIRILHHSQHGGCVLDWRPRGITCTVPGVRRTNY